MTAPTHLAVGLLKKPHGVKGDVLIFPLTDAPEQVFTVGRTLSLLDRQGRLTGGELLIEKSRSYHRAWLVHFKGVNDRTALEALREKHLGIPVGEARPLEEGEFYLHELVGLKVLEKDKSEVGLVHAVYDAPQGYLLGVRSETGKEHLIPFTPEIIRRVDREKKLVVVTPPPGLLDL